MARKRVSTRVSTHDLPLLAVRAAVEPSSLDDQARTVEVVWTTGARVLRGFFDRFFEELSLDPKHVRMGRLNDGAPLLNAHSSETLSDVIGVVKSARLEKGRGVATVRFAAADVDPAADAIFRKVKDGIIRNVSVGYRVHKMEKVEDGDDKIPVYRAVDWEPHEISMVPIGADAGASVRASGATNPCEFVAQERKMDDETPAEKPIETTTRKTDDGDVVSRAKAKMIAEREHEAELRAIAAKTERDRQRGVRDLADLYHTSRELLDSVLDGGTSVEEAEEIFKRAWEVGGRVGKGDGDGDVRPGEDARDKFIRGASAWLFHRSGVRPMLEAAKRKDPELFKGVEFDPGEFRGYTPVDLARQCLERQGVSTRGMDRMKLVGMAFTHRSPTNYQTTGDFPILLENVLGKVLLGAYALQPNTWERICKTDEVADFRTSNRYRTGSLPGLDVIAEHAEYTSGAVPDGSKYGIATQRMGKMFGLSRETIINDDMSALTDMATKLGQAAMRSIETGVYALINANSGLGPTQSDSQPFFHANRANVNATGSGLSVAGIEADAVVMSQQKDPNSLDYIDLQPAILLVPRALLGTGKEINDAQYDFDNAGTNTTGKFQRPNRVRGLFQEVVASPRLSHATRRYIIASPLDWIVVAFLEGYGRGPTMESQDGWRIDGVEWKVTLYAKPQMGDPKAAVTNAGA